MHAVDNNYIRIVLMVTCHYVIDWLGQSFKRNAQCALKYC
ncbi:hypothetical protein VCRA2122O12_30128 [Vibrio crassostreae]|nr:hypothetical protein VCRA2113O119_130067 [Vibrio crassostreae]CAK1754773.1 hypothetical protein VCRA2110O113_130090 [Vibrio crassostreae]CAK2338384.1 hypothetical protein VCRA2110O318_40182 [Vibrio crassostreae]CAK2507941.1 hypothetical protein VCRA2110O319_50183 [Vibrio crassostreae]CAK2605676.1 hypothetical protein VCRA2119O124_120090 [Vibrio crassostreae]